MDLSKVRFYVGLLDDGRACFGVIREDDLWQDSFHNGHPPRPRALWLREGWHMRSMTAPNGQGAAMLRIMGVNEQAAPRVQHSEPIPWLGIAASSQQNVLWEQFEAQLRPELLERVRGYTLDQSFGGLNQPIFESGCRLRVVGMIVGERQCVFQVEPWERADPLANDAVIALVADTADFPNNRYQVYTFGQVKPARTSVIHFG